MERNFKTLMIDRSQKQFNLTREGQRIYESAKEILHVYEKLESELQEMKKVISGTIRISTIYSIGLHELPPYIKKFLHDYPSVNVRVEYASFESRLRRHSPQLGRFRLSGVPAEDPPD